MQLPSNPLRRCLSDLQRYPGGRDKVFPCAVCLDDRLHESLGPFRRAADGFAAEAQSRNLRWAAALPRRGSLDGGSGTAAAGANAKACVEMDAGVPWSAMSPGMRHNICDPTLPM